LKTKKEGNNIATSAKVLTMDAKVAGSNAVEQKRKVGVFIYRITHKLNCDLFFEHQFMQSQESQTYSSKLKVEEFKA